MSKPNVDAATGVIKYLSPALLADFNLSQLEVLRAFIASKRLLAQDLEDPDPKVRIPAYNLAKAELMMWSSLAAKEAGGINPLITDPTKVIETLNVEQLRELKDRVFSAQQEAPHQTADESSEANESPPPSDPD